jgi:hypothetical protein
VVYDFGEACQASQVYDFSEGSLAKFPANSLSLIEELATKVSWVQSCKSGSGTEYILA